jgi:hypothetical protein
MEKIEALDYSLRIPALTAIAVSDMGGGPALN